MRVLDVAAYGAIISTWLRLAVCYFVAAAFCPVAPAYAQGAEPDYTIETEPFLHIDGKVETALPIRVGPGSSPKQAMVLVHGLNSAFSLTRGRLFDSGIWAIGISELSNLKIMASSRAAGSRFPLTVSLVSLDGAVLARTALTLIVREPSEGMEKGAVNAPLASQTRSTVSAVQPWRTETRPAQQDEADRRAAATLALATPEEEDIPPSSALSAAPPKSAIPAREETERLRSAEEALALNDFSGARLILEYLARRGSAAGAYRLAQTYDPDIVRGGAGPGRVSKEKAATWYAKAAELGHADARKKLSGR